MRRRSFFIGKNWNPKEPSFYRWKKTEIPRQHNITLLIFVNWFAPSGWDLTPRALPAWGDRDSYFLLKHRFRLRNSNEGLPRNVLHIRPTSTSDVRWFRCVCVYVCGLFHTRKWIWHDSGKSILVRKVYHSKYSTINLSWTYTWGLILTTRNISRWLRSINWIGNDTYRIRQQPIHICC